MLATRLRLSPLPRALLSSSLSSAAATTSTPKDVVNAASQTGHKDVTTNIKAAHNENVVWSDALLTKDERAKLLNAKNGGATLWVTGLSGCVFMDLGRYDGVFSFCMA